MKIQYCSDLHLEFPENKKYIIDNPIIPKADILILAGDIIPLREIKNHDYFFDYLSTTFKMVYWIAGNHEYYHSNLENRTGQFQENIRANVILLNNTVVELNNTRFIFSTLWSKIHPKNENIIERGMNDFHLIIDGDQLFSVKKYNQLFDENLEFIKQAIKDNKKEKCVVVTHHVPTYDNYPPEYLNSTINNAFATNLNDFINDNNIDTWIYGHHHRNIDEFNIGKTTLLTNQLGYIRAKEHLEYVNGKTFVVHNVKK